MLFLLSWYGLVCLKLCYTCLWIKIFTWQYFPIWCFSKFAVPIFLFQYLHFLEGTICTLLLPPVSSTLPSNFSLCLQEVKKQLKLCLIFGGLIPFEIVSWTVSQFLWYWPEINWFFFIITLFQHFELQFSSKTRKLTKLQVSYCFIWNHLVFSVF